MILFLQQIFYTLVISPSPLSLYKLFQRCAAIGQNIIPMHPPPIILHHHQPWCFQHQIFLYCKPEASYITYPSYIELSYTTLFWNSLYRVSHTKCVYSSCVLYSTFPITAYCIEYCPVQYSVEYTAGYTHVPCNDIMLLIIFLFCDFGFKKNKQCLFAHFTRTCQTTL